MNNLEELLTQKKIRFESKGKDLLIQCLNPEHEDNNPSLRVDREEGMFHCLGCGYKGNIFTLFNKTRNIFNSKVRKLQSAIAELRKASWSGLAYPQDAFFISESFRGIPKEIVERFEGFRTSEIGMQDRVVFPIYDSRNILVGFQGRLEHSDANPRYMAYPKEQPLPWYPNIHKIKHQGTIVLVEGLRDALVLHSKGIECAVCIFGTKSVNIDNILDHVTPFMLTGVSKVVILMDGDLAGRKAAQNLELCISRKTDLEVEVLDLPDGVDPATMDNSLLNLLTSKLNYNNITLQSV